MKFNSQKIKKTLTEFFQSLGTMKVLPYIFIVGILVLINVISYIYVTRLDITQGRIYSLSGSTLNTIESLDKSVVIKTFFDDDPPDDKVNIPREVNEFLDEYVARSNGKIRYENLHPSASEPDADEAKKIGLPEVPLNSLDQEKQKLELGAGYFGIGVYYGDDQSAFEIIPRIDTVQNLEYELTRRIKKLESGGLPTMGFLVGHNEYGLTDFYPTVKTDLEEHFNVTTVDISQGKPIIEIDILVIPTPKSKYSERELFELDQYIMTGGKVIWLVDGVDIDLNSATSSALDNNVNDLLENYGVTVDQKIIIDRSNWALDLSRANLGLVYYPFFIEASNNSINSDNPALRGIESIKFAWASPLQTSSEKDGRMLTPLVYSSKRTSTIGVNDNISPDREYSNFDNQQYVLAYLIEGKQDSYFADKKYPTIENDPRDSKDIIKNVENSNMIVIGDADLISVIAYQQGDPTFLNLSEWLVSDDSGFFELRNKSRNLGDRSLDEVDSNQQTTIKALNILLVPSLVAIIGISIAVYRNKRKPLV